MASLWKPEAVDIEPRPRARPGTNFRYDRAMLNDIMSSPTEHRNLPEVIFLVEAAPEGGFTARALGESIFTEANDLVDLHDKVRDAVHCHFEEGKVPKVIRLHFVREEVISA